MPEPSELESTVLGVWRELFDAQPVGLDDSFFTLGGDSLSAAIIVARLNSLLSIHIQPSDLFRQPTVSRLSGHIESLRRRGDAAQSPARRES
jgi:acyl carrier protein